MDNRPIWMDAVWLAADRDILSTQLWSVMVIVCRSVDTDWAEVKTTSRRSSVIRSSPASTGRTCTTKGFVLPYFVHLFFCKSTWCSVLGDFRECGRLRNVNIMSCVQRTLIMQKIWMVPLWWLLESLFCYLFVRTLIYSLMVSLVQKTLYVNMFVFCAKSKNTVHVVTG